MPFQYVLRAWMQAQPLDSGPRAAEDYLPLALRDALPAVAATLRELTRVRTRHAGADGAERLLVELADGETVESVLLPRAGLCVSTQVGCAVGCTFCMTGRDGLRRHVGSAEIVAQVALARSLRVVREEVVFMGMGEPAHKLSTTFSTRWRCSATKAGSRTRTSCSRRSATGAPSRGCRTKP